MGGVVWLNVIWFVCRGWGCEGRAVGVGVVVMGIRVSS